MKNESNIQPCDHSVVRTFCGIFSDIDHLPQEMYTDRKDLTLPAINVIETAGTYLFEMALPGYQATDLRLEREEDVLTVHAATPPLHSKEVMKYYKQEFVATSFTRSFLLPEDVGTVSAGFANGVLTIRLSKQLPALPANLQERQVIPIQ